ncbi:MAG TPA: hypothetical protein VFQ90_19445 [Stellaceae bacterium]|jgi:hypothetical protein|nr:hypothetical protein [Stellaceae bacterium]
MSAHGVAEYAAVAVAAAALTGLGTLPASVLDRCSVPPRLLRVPLLLMAGWGLASLLSALATFVAGDQKWLARILLIVGLVLLAPIKPSNRAAQRHLLSDLAILLILVAPMGLLVAGTPATMYDEFAQWLPNTRYLVEHGHYWLWPDWVGLSSKPGYPNASAVVPLLVAQLAGPDVEAPFKTFVVVLLGGFGAALASLAATRWMPDETRPSVAAIALLAGGCLIALLNPFIDPRVAFTAYTDTPSALVLALTVLCASQGIGAAHRGADRAAGAWFAWAGLLSLTLVLLRTTNLVLVAAVIGGSVLLMLRTRSPRLWARYGLSLTAPPLVGVAAWSAHLRAARIGPDIAPRPPGLWDWSAPLRVLHAFFVDRLAAHPLLGAAAALAAAAALFGGAMAWRRLGTARDESLPPARVIAALAVVVSGSFVAFLAWAYIAVFSPREVANAASLWRYLSELGPMLLLATVAVILSMMPHRPWHRGQAVAVAAIGALLLAAQPLVGRSFYRLDCRFPDVAAARAAIAELRPALEPFAAPALYSARVAVVHPTMGDWMAYALAFNMRWPASDQLVRYRVQDEPLSDTEAWAWDQGLDALLDFRPLDRAALHDQSLIPSVSLLGRPTAKGDAWSVLAKTESHPLARCEAISR